MNVMVLLQLSLVCFINVHLIYIDNFLLFLLLPPLSALIFIILLCNNAKLCCWKSYWNHLNSIEFKRSFMHFSNALILSYLSWNCSFLQSCQDGRIHSDSFKGHTPLVPFSALLNASVNMTNRFEVFSLPSVHLKSESCICWDGQTDNLIKL